MNLSTVSIEKYRVVVIIATGLPKPDGIMRRERVRLKRLDAINGNNSRTAGLG